ncbi:ATP synthase epsilon chain [Aureimonas sp. SA4125]|uniref:F0F1 ATP synthase subunit epsilon n=1 Tax=Aureimonas sp. SA4125 TaxID=2826993 RepID=UPI001CC64A86|nr:F0F1 ATP synthase subunit epsilon [Aureimonas sp. SA4125]BDA86613.1 ATP synthase epsilon chain [Aureimonas sp. SA4125]
MADSFQFELVSPERLLVSEAATAILAPGTDGYMTVMAGHSPVMSTLKPGVVVVTTAGGIDRRFYVRGGFADITNAAMIVLAEHAVPVEEMNPAELDRQIKDAEEDVADAKTPETRSRAEQQLSALRDARSALGM